METVSLTGGFNDTARDAASAFRAIMNAIARPGQIQTVTGALPPPPLSAAAGAVLLTLCDTDTPVYLAGDADCAAVRDWLAFHTGAPLTGPSHCMFALGRWEALIPLSQYPIGTPEYPDRSATLIVESDTLNTNGSDLTGPGIRERSQLLLPDPDAIQSNQALFPLGIDFLLTSRDQVAGLPRSTSISTPENA